MAKLWGGRFQKNTDKKVDDFNSSIRFDKRMYKQDIAGSMAHAEMLGKQGIISKEDSEKIIKGLEEILAENLKKNHPPPQPLFPPHGILDFDWSIIEDPPKDWNRRILDLGK